MNLVYVSRSEWGASAETETFIRNRVRDDADDKTEIHVHHTAAVDSDDSTPNRWDFDEAVAYMRRLQWARPDLGPLPYSENLAVSEDAETVWVFQGRGILVRGAHTGGHNRPGVGFGVFGNFDRTDTEAAAAAVEAIERRVAGYRQTVTPKLGDTKNPAGWNAWGHRDSSSKTCPGHSLYPLLENFQLDNQGENEMTELQARIEVGVGVYERTGQFMTAAHGESAQERLTRIGREVASGQRTVEDVLQHFGEPELQAPTVLPGWVLSAHIRPGTEDSGHTHRATVTLD